MRLRLTMGTIALNAVLLGGCYYPPPGYGYYPMAASAYPPGPPAPAGPYQAAEESAWSGSSNPIYVPSRDRPGCMEYQSTRTAADVPQPLVKTICPAPDGSLRVITGSAATP